MLDAGFQHYKVFLMCDFAIRFQVNVLLPMYFSDTRVSLETCFSLEDKPSSSSSKLSKKRSGSFNIKVGGLSLYSPIC